MSLILDGSNGLSDVDGTAATPAIRGTDTNTGIFFPAADTIAFSEGGVEAMRIDSSGNVGINTTTPAAKLSVDGSAIFNDSGADVDFRVEGDTDANLLFVDASTDRVGVGTNAPLTKLDVLGPAGVTSFTGTTRLGVTVKGSTGTTDYSGIDLTGNGVSGAPFARIAVLSTGGGSFLQFGTSNNYALGITNTAASIDPAGNLSVGTTSVYANAKVTFDSKTAGYPALAAFKTVTGDLGTPAIVVSKFDNNDTTSQVLVQFLYNNGAAGLGQINGNGGSQAAFGSYSDVRLKDNIADLPTQLGKICALRPVEFDYKDGSGHQIGFIAQEIQEVYPDAVGVGHNEMLTVTGWNKTEARLVKAIQELKAEFDAYKAAHP